MFHKNTFEPGGVQIEEVIPGTSKQYSFGLRCLMVLSKGEEYGQFRDVTERNNTDIIGSDFITSANRERGKTNVNSIEDAWEETLQTDAMPGMDV